MKTTTEIENSDLILEAAGLVTLSEILKYEAPQPRKDITDIQSFANLLQSRYESAMVIRAKLILDDNDDCELAEWALSHSHALSEIRNQLTACYNGLDIKTQPKSNFSEFDKKMEKKGMVALSTLLSQNYIPLGGLSLHQGVDEPERFQEWFLMRTTETGKLKLKFTDGSKKSERKSMYEWMVGIGFIYQEFYAMYVSLTALVTTDALITSNH